MTLDILHFIDSKGGNAAEIRESQRKRGLSVELVDEVIQMYADWVKMDFEVNKLSKEVNAVQKEIGAKKKAKENADSLVAKKKSLDEQVLKKRSETKEFEQSMRQKASTVGNIVGKNVPVSMNEDDNTILRTWHPKGPNATVSKRTNIMPHHEVLLRLDAIDLERGAKIAGHRGYFLTNDGIDLNQALITYGLHFLRERGYTTLQPPFFMNRDMMAKTAQLEQFDEELYKVVVSSSSSASSPSSTSPSDTTTSTTSTTTTQPQETETDKYLIATSEQPISCFHSSEWFESPHTQLPLKYAGYSTCFRKEAGSAGRDTWGIFRVHQFEKVEQFVITSPFPDPGAPSSNNPASTSPSSTSPSSNPNDPSSTTSPENPTPELLPPSWQMLETMLLTSEHFYQSLSLPYRVVAIVSGALNLAAAEKRDLEAWFPFQGEWKELVSCSNCTDYQSRRLEIRAGLKSKDQTRKQYVHMLNGTLCATERALCCLVENWQTEEGLVIPEVLRPYMQNREFLPWKKELPKNLQRKQA